MKPEEVGRLTFFQLRNIFFCKRDEKGHPLPEPNRSENPNPSGNTPLDHYRSHCLINGIFREDHIQALFKAELKKQANEQIRLQKLAEVN